MVILLFLRLGMFSLNIEEFGLSIKGILFYIEHAKPLKESQYQIFGFNIVTVSFNIEAFGFDIASTLNAGITRYSYECRPGSLLLLPFANCTFLVICYLLFTICYFQYAIYYLLFAIYYLLFIIFYSLLAI